MRAGNWFIGWLAIVLAAFGVIGYWVARVDPYFHYHSPDVGRYYYELNNQRSQNDGICRHFSYDALITGTSLTENFRTTEMDSVFGCHSIKAAYSGGTYKEINDGIARALRVNPELKTVVRCLDMIRFLDPPDLMRPDLGEYPYYLYDRNPLNDGEYLLNRELLFNRVLPMLEEAGHEGARHGITTFDAYSRWQETFTYGINTVCPDGLAAEGDAGSTENDSTSGDAAVSEKNGFSGDAVTKDTGNAAEQYLTDGEKDLIRENVTRNITDLADAWPEVTFYYCYSPYSIVWWHGKNRDGSIRKWLEAERYITELIIPHENIHLFSFNNRTDITTDLNNYKDEYHFASWVNSLMLKWMHDGTYRLTEENYEEYLRQEYDFYTTFDYESITGQQDYEADWFAAALLNQELTGEDPVDLLNSGQAEVTARQASFDTEGGHRQGFTCTGRLDRQSGGGDLIPFLRDTDGYVGVRCRITLDGSERYLSFRGQKIAGQGRPSVYVFGPDGQLAAKLEKGADELDYEEHLYTIPVTGVRGEAAIIFNGGAVARTESEDSAFRFSEIRLY